AQHALPRAERARECLPGDRRAARRRRRDAPARRLAPRRRRRSLSRAGAAGARRGCAPAGARAALWAPAPGRAGGSAGARAQGAAARRARRRRTLGRERHHRRDDREPAGGDRRADHRARYGSRLPPGAAHHRAGAGRRAGRRHAAGDRRRPARARGLSRRACGPMSGSGIVLDAVRAGYGETVVLEGVSLSLPPRGTLALLGRNGVGKTTLLATIMGHTTLHGGAILLDGSDIARVAPHRRARLGLGWVPQEREIFRSLTVEENLPVAE